MDGAPKASAVSQKFWKTAMKAKDTAFAVEGTPDGDAENSDDDHKIMPTETIRIDVYGEKDLTVPELRVQAGGQVKYFLLGDVQVGGLTAREAANSIRKQLMDGQYLQDPQVIVTVVQYRKRYVYVLGDVNHPGAVPLEGENRYTIPDVIGQAGGLTRVGIKKFDFIRQGKIERLNLDNLNKATDRKKQIFVQPNDTIYIKQSIW
jgi:polysaccharide export outer membrane protein